MTCVGCSPPSNAKIAARSCSPKPRALSSELTRCTDVTRSSKWGSWTTTHWKPYVSERRRTFERALSAATLRSSSISRSARANSLAERGLKTTAAAPEGRRPSSVSSVICAVERAKSLSSLAPLRRFRPKRMSVRPTSVSAHPPWGHRDPPSGFSLLGAGARVSRGMCRDAQEPCGAPVAPEARCASRRDGLRGNRAAHLAGDLAETGKPLLERRGGHEELAHRPLPVRGDDEERVHALDLAQVALRDPRHLAGDLLERAHELLGRARDDRGAAVGRVLPVPR